MAQCQGVVWPPAPHPRNSGCGRAAETESAPRLQRRACPKSTAARRSCRRSPRPWEKVEQRVLVTVKDAIKRMKNAVEILASLAHERDEAVRTGRNVTRIALAF